MAIPISNCRRQFPRYNGITRITLVARPAWKRVTILAATVDISSHGLKIQSPAYLITGQRIDVLFPGPPAISRTCQVEWTKPAGTLQPGEAGLRFLEPVREIPLGEEERVMTEPPAMAA
jgi:hypothetical protein